MKYIYILFTWCDGLKFLYLLKSEDSDKASINGPAMNWQTKIAQRVKFK